MMPRLSLEKTLLACAIMLVFMGITFSISRAFEAVTKNKVEYKTIQEALNIRGNPWSMLRWNLDKQPEGRSLGAGDAYMLGRAYTEGMLSLTSATASGHTGQLKQFFTANAYDRAYDAAEAADGKHQMIVLGAEASANLFHLDGSLIQFSADNVLTARFYDAPDSTAPVLLSRECQALTMFNQTSGWRIGTLERRCAAPIATEPAPIAFIPNRLVGINYYPRNAPWHEFWPNMTMEEVDQDLRRIRALGGNAIRIFLQFDAFNDVDQIEPSLIKLLNLLDSAQTYGITVMPTLFDLRADYRPKTWAESWAYMHRILKAIGTHPAVHIIDIKNEPDRDFKAHGERRVLAWLETMARLGREISPHIAFTVGWMEAQFAPLLHRDLGVISYHDYEDPNTIEQRLIKVKTAVGDKPVLITEIGTHSWSPISALPFPSSQAKQSKILRTQINGLGASNGHFVWTLHDFDHVPNIVAGALPWRKAMQKHYGLLDADGLPKPAAQAFIAGGIGKPDPFKLPQSFSLLENLKP